MLIAAALVQFVREETAPPAADLEKQASKAQPTLSVSN